MRQRNESFAELLTKLPWQVSILLGVFTFVGLRWILPDWWGEAKSFAPIKNVITNLAPFAALFFGATACLSFWFRNRRNALVDQQASLETLRETTWKDFEYLVAEAYRRQGYQVTYSLGKGADGGVDLIICKAGRTSLVQCKQWKTFSVGAPVIREQFGIMTAEKADEAIIVTSGKFTAEAESFALGKPIQLLDGPGLLELVKQVQRRSPTSRIELPASNEPPALPRCPVCSKNMVLRTARRGSNAGNKFWGCTDYPRCKGTSAV
ncbi:MAG: hypothetical protein JWQ71_3218 [Pedosphaera sp.]|nr:hypothetical protein [Pedosphaera sp.]